MKAEAFVGKVKGAWRAQAVNVRVSREDNNAGRKPRADVHMRLSRQMMSGSIPTMSLSIYWAVT